MHSAPVGRAEAVRTLLRRSAVAVAPGSFGLLADALFSGRASAGGARATPPARMRPGSSMPSCWRW
jgi:hypothetical protein